jgi:hypothetical protein
LNLQIAPSSLTKPKPKPGVVPAKEQLWKNVHVEPQDGDQLCAFFCMIDGQFEVNMWSPLCHPQDADVKAYKAGIDCIGHIINPIVPGGTKVINRRGYPLKALMFSIGLGMTKQEIRAHIEAYVHP